MFDVINNIPPGVVRVSMLALKAIVGAYVAFTVVAFALNPNRGTIEFAVKSALAVTASLAVAFGLICLRFS